MNTRVPAGHPRRSNESTGLRANPSNAFMQVIARQRNGSSILEVYACARAHARVDPCALCSHWESSVTGTRSTRFCLRKHELPMGAAEGAPIGIYRTAISGAM